MVFVGLGYMSKGRTGSSATYLPRKGVALFCQFCRHNTAPVLILYGMMLVNHTSIRFTSTFVAIPTPAGIRYPDLVIWKNGLCVVVDTTIVSNHKPPDDAHERKVIYYDQPAIRGWCEMVSGVAADEVKFSACVLTWHGVPSQRPVRELRTLGVTKSNWMLLSVKMMWC